MAHVLRTVTGRIDVELRSACKCGKYRAPASPGLDEALAPERSSGTVQGGDADLEEWAKARRPLLRRQLIRRRR